MQVKTSQNNIDVAYWWVMTLVVVNFISSLLTFLLNSVALCSSIDQMIELKDDDGYGYLTINTRSKVLVTLCAISWTIQILWVLLPFLSVPIISRIVLGSE